MKKPKSQAKPKREASNHFEESIAGLSPSLQREMQALRIHEAKILKLLSDPQKAEQYLSDPLSTLEAHGIEVPVLLKRRLQQFDPNLAEHLRRQTYALPGGQTVTARIRVHFTRGLKEG